MDRPGMILETIRIVSDWEMNMRAITTTWHRMYPGRGSIHILEDTKGLRMKGIATFEELEGTV